MEFGIIGTSIWQQNMKLLEHLTVDRTARVEVLRSLKTSLGLSELVYLATCNRVEFVYVSTGKYAGAKLLHKLIDYFFRDIKGLGFFPNDFYHYSGREAVAHLFRTTASLESLVVGENQIAGQYKDAYMEALASGLAGATLKDISEEALLVAKKVKRDTEIGLGAVSMASLAADELAAYLNPADNPVIALVGTGAMTLKLAHYVQDNKLGKLLFVNRTAEKADTLAQQFDGNAISLTDFIDSRVPVDAILSATAATEAIFDAEFIDSMPERTKPVLCIDLAIPRDFGNEFNNNPKVKLVDIPYLRSKCNGNLRQKFVETSKANEIVRDAVNQYLSDRMEVSLKPIFHDSYQESMKLAKNALDDLFAKKVTGLTEEEKEAVYRLVTKLVANSAFQPVKMLSNKLIEMGSELEITEVKKTHKEAV
ncbi:MAG: glutamyl-tRNA reductase [Candidatus Zixiibacteriota bacterium]